MYLHKILNREQEHWTKKMLIHLQSENLEWAKNMEKKLNEYQLEPDWNIIQRKTKGEWKRAVTEAVDKINKEKLIQNCTTTSPENIKVNTKTKNIHKDLQSASYTRQPLKEILNESKQRTKTLILARHGMLECGTNYKGTMSETCKHCNKYDDENHRLNECTLLTPINRSDNIEKTNFNDIYSSDTVVLGNIIEHLECIWEFRYANGKMKRT